MAGLITTIWAMLFEPALNLIIHLMGEAIGEPELILSVITLSISVIQLVLGCAVIYAIFWFVWAFQDMLDKLKF